jgi:hypothetical protein
MKKLHAFLAALALMLLAGGSALAADGSVTTSERVIISIQGDVTLPAGEEAGAVIVFDGDATILGTVEAVVVVRGTATLTGAHVQSLAIVDGTAEIGAGSTVFGDVTELNGVVNRAEGATVGGTIHPMANELAGFAVFLGFAALLIWIGFAIMTLVVALALAGLASRQVRTAEAIISREPVKAFLVGLLMLVLPPILIVALAVSVIGLPLALTLLFAIWPAMAFVGYLVAAIWIGEWLLRATGRRGETERPYLAAFVGVLVAGALGIVPIVTGVVSIFGLGSITVAAWRTLTGGTPAATPIPTRAVPVPS